MKCHIYTLKLITVEYLCNDFLISKMYDIIILNTHLAICCLSFFNFPYRSSFDFHTPFQYFLAFRVTNTAMSNTPNWLTAEYVQKFLQNSFNDKDLKVEDIIVSAGSCAGDGYLSQILRIKLLRRRKKFQLLLKCY